MEEIIKYKYAELFLNEEIYHDYQNKKNNKYTFADFLCSELGLIPIILKTNGKQPRMKRVDKGYIYMDISIKDKNKWLLAKIKYGL